MKTQNSLFNSNIILKPWGEEYVICAKKNKFAITYLKIKPGKKTSLHCHSKKKNWFYNFRRQSNSSNRDI